VTHSVHLASANLSEVMDRCWSERTFAPDASAGLALYRYLGRLTPHTVVMINNRKVDRCLIVIILLGDQGKRRWTVLWAFRCPQLFQESGVFISCRLVRVKPPCLYAFAVRH
jgi:hypothetical protein